MRQVVLVLVAKAVIGVTRDGEWTRGTWTTSYWDCCKPSCAWPGKTDNVNGPVVACDPQGNKLWDDPGRKSVCDNGGSSASCPDNQPWTINEGLSYGFAAAATNSQSISGLNGDDNCGQCFELVFTDQTWPWGGGAHPDIVGKSHVVQVTNVGYDVNGEHSFDLQLPGAGMGTFMNGCRAQYGNGYNFDCNNNWNGGCRSKNQCAQNLPDDIVEGCEWRFDSSFKWGAGQPTNNPFVDFRRVKCPDEIVAITGSQALDDNLYPSIDPLNYISGGSGGDIGSDGDIGGSGGDSSRSGGGGQCVDNWNPCGSAFGLSDDCCGSGFSCFRKDDRYSQCRTECLIGATPPWDCDDTVSCIKRGDKCDVPSECCKGATCFRKNEEVAKCRKSCKPGWACAHCIPDGELCGLEFGLSDTCCNQNSNCFRKDDTYAECRGTCKIGENPPWDCDDSGVGLSEECAPKWTSCTKGETCCGSDLCFRQSKYYSQCRPSCPDASVQPGWDCQT